ncbi:MAG: substrate-binding domain-containing protein [Prevotella sp.]|nr:substrate-binding domain-containing protein [Prevotella sp.]
MNRTVSKLIGLTLILGLFHACVNKPKTGRTDTLSSGHIEMACDESFSPIIDEELDIFSATRPNAEVTPIYTNEQEAVQMLMEEKIFLAITSRQFTKNEYNTLKNKGYKSMRSAPIAYDGLALIINNDNLDSCITVKDVVRILSGEATQWSDIYPGSKRGEIEVVFDNPKSSTVRYAQDSILGGKPINSPNIQAVDKSAEVISYVEKTPNALGIIGSNWLDDKRDTTNVTFKKNIRVMAVSRMETATPSNSYQPYQGYIYNDRYPFIRTLYCLLNDSQHGLPSGFANFIASQPGQLIIFHSALLPAYGNVTTRNIIVNK